MAVLVECHNFHLSPVEQKLECGQMFLQICRDEGWNFPLTCTKACEYEPLFQFISVNLG